MWEEGIECQKWQERREWHQAEAPFRLERAASGLLMHTCCFQLMFREARSLSPQQVFIDQLLGGDMQPWENSINRGTSWRKVLGLKAGALCPVGAGNEASLRQAEDRGSQAAPRFRKHTILHRHVSSGLCFLLKLNVHAD